MLLSISDTLWICAIFFFVSADRLLFAEEGIMSSRDMLWGILPAARVLRVDWVAFIWSMAVDRPLASGVS